MKYMSNMPIFHRLFLAFALTTLVPGVIIIFLGVFYLNNLDTRGQAVRTSFDAQNTASLQQISLQRMNAQLETRFAQIYAVRGGAIQDPSLKASGALIEIEIRSREVDFDQTLRDYATKYEVATSENMKGVRDILLNDDPANISIIRDQQTALNQVIGQQQWISYKSAQDKVLDLLDDPATPYQTAYAALFDARSKFLPLHLNWQKVSDTAILVGTTVTQIGPSQTQPIIGYTVASFFFTMLVIIATGYIVNVTITRPLRNLAFLTRRIARGDTSARAPIRGRDEIAIVSASMNTMLDSIVRLMHESRMLHANLQSQVEKLVNEVSGVGEGDLRIQAEVTTDDLGVLADSFNYMVEELSNLVIRVKTLTHEVRNSAAATFDRMARLVQSGDFQFQQIETSVVEVGRMADSSRQVSERAESLYKVAYEAQSAAQSGRQAVQQTVQGMERIYENVQGTASNVQLLGARSREIDNIVEAIASIAHQTNRLALDAAIQAAMAGENGKGFGAVAADIRRLAERSKEQTAMITRIVRSVLEDIGTVAVSMNDTERETSQGTTLAREAGNALESIFSVVERQASEIENINRVVAQQLESSKSVAQIMNNVAQATQQNSASTREASQRIERMARIAEQLLASVDAFKLPDDDNYQVQNGGNEIISGPVSFDNSLAGLNNNGYREQQPEPAGFFSGYAMPPTPYQTPDNRGLQRIVQQDFPAQQNGNGHHHYSR